MVHTIETQKMNKEECFEAVTALTKLVDMEITGSKDAIKNLPELRSKRQRMARTFGKTLRYLSQSESRKSLSR